jgi:hypothetical protein
MWTNTDHSLEHFARHFLTGRINWWAVPRQDAIHNYDSIVGIVLYRKDQYQVELFIVPYSPSSFTLHCHPDVDTYEFPLTGDNALYLDGELMFTTEQVRQWLQGQLRSQPVHIAPDMWHCGHGATPYAFLSIQHWLHGVQPTSVGLNWQGLPSSARHAAFLNREATQQLSQQQEV